jgi:ABC-type antimicrobial peptide transport system permease subunit
MGGGIVLDVEVEGGRQVPRTLVGGIANAYGNVVSPEWFATIGTPIVAGRGFDTRDRAGAPRVAIVNEALARAFLGDTNPVGRTLKVNEMDGKRALEVIGVAADSIYGSIREPSAPIVYLPLGQTESMVGGGPFIFLVVRAATTAPAALTKTVLAAANGVQPGLKLAARPLADQLDASLTQERVLAMLSGFFGALALLLAALGLYGVTSYAVSRRRAELGVRVALGATPDCVMRLVLSRIMALVTIGVAAGGVASLWASRFVSALLYGVTPRDPVTFVAAGVALAAIALAAGGVPAWRAAHLDPARVLRDE